MAKDIRSGDSTVRVDAATSAAISRFARESGLPRTKIVALAVEQLRRKRIMESANAIFAAMKKGSAWREELEEREIWDATIADGLTRQ